MYFMKNSDFLDIFNKLKRKQYKGRKEKHMANAKYFLKRFAMALLTIFLVACLTFLLMNAVPGSPWLSEKTPSAATLAALNAKYGLDKPVHVQLLCI